MNNNKLALILGNIAWCEGYREINELPDVVTKLRETKDLLEKEFSWFKEERELEETKWNTKTKCEECNKDDNKSYLTIERLFDLILDIFESNPNFIKGLADPENYKYDPEFKIKYSDNQKLALKKQFFEGLDKEKDDFIAKVEKEEKDLKHLNKLNNDNMNAKYD